MKQKYTIKDQFEQIKEGLKGIYPEREIKVIANMLFEKVLGLKAVDIHIHLGDDISYEIQGKFQKALHDLQENMPIQYIIGEAEFYGLTFKLDSNVLIPRPETEELVHQIVSDYKNHQPKILDIGTGSCCIAIALAKNIASSNIWASDISAGALEIAKMNAVNNEVNITFIQDNILQSEIDENEMFDVIVSNPPYVLKGDKTYLSKNVIDFEPHTALFVDDNDPLIFYREIASFATKHLNPKGKLYFEINEKYGQEVVHLLKSRNYKNVLLLTDINGKQRMVTGEF